MLQGRSASERGALENLRMIGGCDDEELGSGVTFRDS
jgi:hypothetical protein